MSSDAAHVKQFCEMVPQVSKDDARKYLARAKQNVQLAISMYFDDSSMAALQSSPGEQFFACLRKGELAQATKLVQANAKLLQYRNQAQATPLLVAVRGGHLQLVLFLLARGVDVREQAGPLRETALHQAALLGHTDMLTALLDAKADVGDASASGRTPLHMACLGAKREAIDVLLAAQASVAARDRNGETPLHLLVQCADTDDGALARVDDAVRRLLAAGANAEERAADGRRPLDVAQHPRIRKALASDDAASPAPREESSFYEMDFDTDAVTSAAALDTVLTVNAGGTSPRKAGDGGAAAASPRPGGAAAASPRPGGGPASPRPGGGPASPRPGAAGAASPRSAGRSAATASGGAAPSRNGAAGRGRGTLPTAARRGGPTSPRSGRALPTPGARGAGGATRARGRGAAGRARGGPGRGAAASAGRGAAVAGRAASPDQSTPPSATPTSGSSSPLSRSLDSAPSGRTPVIYTKLPTLRRPAVAYEVLPTNDALQAVAAEHQADDTDPPPPPPPVEEEEEAEEEASSTPTGNATTSSTSPVVSPRAASPVAARSASPPRAVSPTPPHAAAAAAPAGVAAAAANGASPIVTRNRSPSNATPASLARQKAQEEQLQAILQHKKQMEENRRSVFMLEQRRREMSCLFFADAGPDAIFAVAKKSAEDTMSGRYNSPTTPVRSAVGSASPAPVRASAAAPPSAAAAAAATPSTAAPTPATAPSSVQPATESRPAPLLATNSIHRLDTHKVPTTAPPPPRPPSTVQPFSTVRGRMVVDQAIVSAIREDAALLDDDDDVAANDATASTPAAAAATTSDAVDKAARSNSPLSGDAPAVSPRLEGQASLASPRPAPTKCRECHSAPSVARVTFASPVAECCSDCALKVKQAEMSAGQRPKCEQCNERKCAAIVTLVGIRGVHQTVCLLCKPCALHWLNRVPPK